MIYAEYCQQIEHLQIPLEDIQKLMDSKSCRYAYLVHDKDTHEDGSIKAPHLHIMMDFKGTSWTPENLAKWFKDDPQRIQKPTSKSYKFTYENMCSYLIHETPNSDGKYKYPPEDVTANFDFVEFINQIRKGVTDAKSKKREHPIADVLQKIMNNEIPRIKLSEYIDDMTNLKYNRDIERAYNIRDTKLAKEIERNMNVIYISGASGTGKTTWAKYIASQRKYSVYVSGSSNDPFEDYMGQECVILDDIRGSDWKINDLLKVLDNNTNSKVRSRYRNKYLNDCKLLILTSVQPIDDLYSNLKEHDTEPIEQLKRRCTDMICFTTNTMTLYTYNPDKKDYELKETLPNMTFMLTYLAQNKDSMIDSISKLARALEEQSNTEFNEITNKEK